MDRVGPLSLQLGRNNCSNMTARLIGLVGKSLVGPVGKVVCPSCILSGVYGLRKAFSPEDLYGLLTLSGLVIFGISCLLAWQARLLSRKILGRREKGIGSCERSKGRLRSLSNLAIFGFGLIGVISIFAMTKDSFFCGVSSSLLCLKISQYKGAIFMPVHIQLQIQTVEI